MIPSATQSVLANKRIFITGGTGTFGKWLIREIKDTACELVLLTRNVTMFLESVPEYASEKITFIEGDVRDFDDPVGHFDYIIHAATPVVSSDLSDAELTDIIVTGTKRVLRYAEQAHCPRLLYVSSGAVYGRQPPELERLPETFPCNPISAYGKAKLIAENLCLSSKVDCVIARCFAFVGPGMPLDAHFAIGNFIGSCLKHESIVIRGDGSPLRSYMYSSDLAEWLLRLLNDGRAGEVYNVGSDAGIPIAELADLVRSVAGTCNSINTCHEVDHAKPVSRYVPCIEKARQELGLVPRIGLQESLKSTISWYKAKAD